MLKFLKVLVNIIRKLITIFLIVFLIIIVTQRITDNKKAIAGLRVFTVITPSMEPEYKIGDAIFTRAVDASQLKIGDDVTYIGKEGSFADKIVTHRIINIEKDNNGLYIFQTKGIANDEADPKINETQIYGKVLYKIKSISYLNGVIGNLYGMYFAIVVPLGLMMVIEFILYSRDKEGDEEYDEDKDKNNNDKSDSKLENEVKEDKKAKKNKIQEDIAIEEERIIDEKKSKKEKLIKEDNDTINEKAIKEAKTKMDKLDRKREKRKSKRNKRREKRRKRNL